MFQGTALCQSGQLPDSRASLETLSADSQKVELMLEIGQETLDKGKLDSARIYFNRADALADSINYAQGRQQALYRLGDLFLVTHKFDSAETVLNRAVSLNPAPSLLLKIQNLLATAHRYRGENQKAVATYKNILAQLDTTKQVRTAAGISQNLADAYMNMGNTAAAFKNYDRAISYAEAAQDSLFLATTLNNVGNAHNDLEQYEDAAYYLERSLEISNLIGYEPGVLRASLNLGITRSGLAQFSEAESLYTRALELSEKIRPETPPIQIQYNLGELYKRMGQLTKAENYFEQSFENSSAAGIPQGLYYNATGLGDLEEQSGNSTEAISWYSRALDVAKKLNNPSFLNKSHQKLYELYKAERQYETALLHLESFKALSDSLKSDQREKMLAEYETRLDVQRREQENRALKAESVRQEARLEFQYGLMGAGLFVLVVVAIFAGLLYKSNREKKEMNDRLEAQKEALEESNEVKNKLFGIVAHDLRTPLGALVGMLELVREETLSEDEMRELFAELELSLQHNVNTMENLLAWSKQQMTGLKLQREPVNVKKLTDEIIQSHEFKAEQKQLALKNNLDHSTRVHADYDVTKLVMRNLISNGIKFSESGGEIVVDSTPQNGEILFKVRDRGIGIPEDIKDSIFCVNNQSRNGTQQERGSGIGLSLCKEFIEKQGGHIYFKSREGEGTTFYFTLPAGKA